MYTPKQKALANELADRLNDRDSIAFHLSLTRLYSEEHIRKILERVMAVPDEKITHSRARLFNVMVRGQ